MMKSTLILIALLGLAACDAYGTGSPSAAGYEASSSY